MYVLSEHLSEGQEKRGGKMRILHGLKFDCL